MESTAHLRIRPVLLMLLLSLSSLAAFAQRTGTGGRPGGGGARPSPGINPNGVPVQAPRPAMAPTLSVPTVQHAEQEGTVEFRSETVLIQVPVVVTDKPENHIPVLKKKAFLILKNGKKENFSAFEEGGARGTGFPAVNPLPAGTFTNVVANTSQPLS